eukprot:33159-Pyramimonas_sp.AAC.1
MAALDGEGEQATASAGSKGGKGETEKRTVEEKASEEQLSLFSQEGAEVMKERLKSKHRTPSLASTWASAASEKQKPPPSEKAAQYPAPLQPASVPGVVGALKAAPIEKGTPPDDAAPPKRPAEAKDE